MNLILKACKALARKSTARLHVARLILSIAGAASVLMASAIFAGNVVALAISTVAFIALAVSYVVVMPADAEISKVLRMRKNPGVRQAP